MEWIAFLFPISGMGRQKKKVIFGKALEILLPPYISQLGAGPDAIYLDSWCLAVALAIANGPNLPRETAFAESQTHNAMKKIVLHW